MVPPETRGIADRVSAESRERDMRKGQLPADIVGGFQIVEDQRKETETSEENCEKDRAGAGSSQRINDVVVANFVGKLRDRISDHAENDERRPCDELGTMTPETAAKPAGLSALHLSRTVMTRHLPVSLAVCPIVRQSTSRCCGQGLFQVGHLNMKRVDR